MSNDSGIIEGEIVSTSRELDVRRHQGGGIEVADGAAAQPFDVRRVVHDALRGRYILAICLGLIVGGAMGFLAWKLGRPLYYSEGIVRIAYSLPTVLQETEANRPMANFEQFMLSQRMVITSRRVIELAMQDPIWRQRGQGVPSGLDQYYADCLKVDIRPRSEFIAISVTDTDPVTAASAVVALVNAYADHYNSQEKQMERQLVGVLEDRQNLLQAKMDQLSNQLRVAAQEYGSTRLDPFYEAAVARLTRLENALADVRLAMASVPEPARSEADSSPASSPATQPTRPAENAAQQLTAEDVALTDAGMRAHLDELERCHAELRRLALRKLGEAHQEVKIANQNLEIAEGKVAGYLDRYRRFQAATAAAARVVTPAPGDPAGAIPLAARTAESLRANEASLVKLHKDTKQEVTIIGNRRFELQKLEQDVAASRAEYDQLSRRLDVLRAESRLGGRLSVISSGEIPVSPIRDMRIRNAAAGAGIGVLMPACVIITLGFVRRRYRFSDETEADLAARIPLLGILPEHDGDVAESPAAAHSVHQIRVSLDASMSRRRSNVLLVTSATAGEGKTTLAASLALSFAAAKVKTLLIDCDLVGRHLTSSLDATETEGVREAIKCGSILKKMRKTYSGLYVLTAGQAATPDAVSISGDSVRAMFAEARRYFQVVIVDSGPILGSLEAAVLAREADGVIFTINRGQHRELVQRALRRLNSLASPIVGFIFNRAKPQDFHRSTYASSTAPARENEPQEDADLWKGETLDRFGPIVRAVASSLRTPDKRPE